MANVLFDWLYNIWHWTHTFCCQTMQCSTFICLFQKDGYIRVMPQGMVDNKDHLACPKVLDPNYCRQATHLLHGLCLEGLTVYGIELCLFGAKAFPLFILLMSCIWHSSSSYNFLSYLAMTRYWPRIEPITSPTPVGCATCNAKDADSGLKDRYIGIFSYIESKLQTKALCLSLSEDYNSPTGIIPRMDRAL